MKTLIEIMVFGLVFSNLDARDPAWFKERMAEIDITPTLANDEAIELLGSVVRIGRREMDDEQLQVYERAKTLLLSIPGHAEYYGKEIHKLMDETMQTRYDGHSRIWAFQTLEQLPSPETVKVLGELLYDTRDPYKDVDQRDLGDTGKPIPNFNRASMALTQLGIRNAPVKNVSTSAGFELSDVNTWQLWYEQVKDGSRTFSFEGDDAIYSLSGKVSVAKDGPTKSRPDRKTTVAAGNGNEPVSNVVDRAPLLVAILFVIGIIAFGVNQVRKRASRMP